MWSDGHPKEDTIEPISSRRNRSCANNEGEHVAVQISRGIWTGIAVLESAIPISTHRLAPASDRRKRAQRKGSTPCFGNSRRSGSTNGVSVECVAANDDFHQL